MNRISTHILDLARGKPASGVPVTLEHQNASKGWVTIATAKTDPDGRVAQLLPDEKLPAGVYRLIFDTAIYFGALRVDSLYPRVEIVFEVRAGETHYHIPLLFNANGYTTYRGS